MAHAREEAAQMASIADALVLNIGTLTTDLMESMILAESCKQKRYTSNFRRSRCRCNRF